MDLFAKEFLEDFFNFHQAWTSFWIDRICPQYGKFIAEIQRIRETTEEVSKETADAIFKRTSYEISTGKSRGIFEEIHKKKSGNLGREDIPWKNMR